MHLSEPDHNMAGSGSEIEKGIEATISVFVRTRNSYVLIIGRVTTAKLEPSWAPSPQLVKCGRARSGCEKTRGISKWKS
ncbi:hypothetical protein THAOC_28511 [Thalassiosira oceanica]|uniref:Uncharacterized protein n=1 Tax=Thalassiosira oceanica TaxID=159749 RepID=K0S070_THAOC|nr:hypothetical protein THAOC_28511 [Thalassiosira oceanica]|eukprot:EJK52242.1 hypothetical protein THAOC_28511 [Thalassiosira oceanica]